MKTPQPRTLPRRPSPAEDPFVRVARRLAQTPPDALADAIERALREAHRAGLAEAAPAALGEAESALADDIARALADGGELALVQPLGPCPGMPWQMEVSSQVVLDASGFAALFPDAGVRALLARGALAAGPDGTLVAGSRLAEVMPAPPTAPRR